MMRLKLAVIGIPVTAPLLLAFTSDPRAAMFVGFVAGCLMATVIWTRKP